MGKSKKKPLVQTERKSNLLDELLEKAVQQTLSLILSFVFTTALIGGSGYVLFQFPIELNAIKPKSLELEAKKEQLETLDKILAITGNSWLLDRAEIARAGEITKWMAQNIQVETIEQTYYLETTDWINQALIRIAYERGEINGYHLENEYYKNMQESIVHEYDLRINILRQMDDIFLHWNKETTAERLERFKTIEGPIYDSTGNLSEIGAKYNQLLAQKEIDLKDYEQRQEEVNIRKYVAVGKLILSIAGILIGFYIFYALGKATLKK